MRRPFGIVTIVILSLAALVRSGGQPKAGSSTPPSPDEIRKSLRLPPGLRVELVACEPQITSPVHMAFDPTGRLWVVEMRDYPNGPGPGQPPAGRIRVLDDADGDGVFEKSTIFADNLLYANGLLHWKDGVIVTAAPHIVHVRDTDGDGKADRSDILYEGFAAQNPQLRVSHPILGIDGWIYVANGLRGGQVVKHGDKDRPIELRGMDFKFDLLADKGEAISGLGQFGNTFDDWGQRFVCDNRHHLRHIVLENRYLRNNPGVAAPAVLQDVSVLGDGPLSSGGKIYPLSKNWTTSSLHEGRFTAACGVFVYRGGLLKDLRGSAFTCDPTGNLVHQEVLTPKGATFTARPPKEGVEFLASPNDWFRPVSLASGPDGALYVVDMCRAVIEHPEFMPPELKTRPDLTWGKDAGRIWRIVPENHAGKASRPSLKDAATADLVKLLDHESDWWRTTAQRLLLERQDESAVKPLRELVRGGTPQAKVLAAGLLDQMLFLDEPSLTALLKDPHPRVREQGILLAEERLEKSPDTVKRIRALARDADPRVRYQVALTLSLLPDAKNATALRSILLAGAGDSWTRLAVRLGLHPAPQPTAAGGTVGKFLEGVLNAKEFKNLPDAVQAEMVEEFAALAGREAIGLGLLVAGKQTAEPLVQRALLLGLAQGLQARRFGLEAYFAKTLPASAEPTLTWLRGFLGETAALAGNLKADPAERLPAVRLLGYVTWDRAVKVLPDVIVNDTNQEVRLAAVRALAAHGHKDLPQVLLEPWRSYSPSVRREVTDALFRQPNYQLALLRAVEAKKIKAGDLDALRTRQLLQNKQPEVRILAEKLLKANIPGDRQQALKTYRAALEVKGDASRGKEVFKKHCAICHKVGGIGVDVGPDIADTRTKTLEGMLVDILLPNQAIDNNYVQYLATTRSGKTITGVLLSESASSVTFKRAEGQTEVVLRSDLEELQSTGVSLMPDGLEKNISIPEMSDLLSFLKNWRYLDGAVPLGK